MKKIIIYTKEKVYNFKSIEDKNYKYALEHAHRKDKPDYIEYYENGNISYKAWYLNGKKHRINGPAVISYYNNGNIYYKKYYINGKIYSEIEFTQEILKKKLQLI